MASEITPKISLREKEWKMRRDRVGAAVLEVSSFMTKKTIDVLPDLYAIKEKKLWEFGDYKSFDDFLQRCGGVSRQHYYRMVKAHPELRKTLEFNSGLSHNATNGDSDESPKEETKYEPPADKDKKKCSRKRKPEPEPVDAEFTSGPPVAQADGTVADMKPTEPLRGIVTETDPPERYDGWPKIGGASNDLPPAANSAEPLATPAPQETESGESRAEKKCPHCGGILE